MSDETQIDLQDQREADEQDATTESDALGDKGIAALKAERDARRAAEKERAELQKRIDAIEQQQREAEDAKAKEKGEWEKVAKQREEELAEVRAQLAARDLRDRKAAIAKQHGIPEEAIGRLSGSTDDELEEDAKALAKILKPREAPETDAGERTPPGTKKVDKSKFADPAIWGLS